MSYPCEIQLKSSRLMMAGLLAGHFSLGLGFLASSLPPAVISLVLAGLATAGVGAFRRWRRDASLRFVLKADGLLQVIREGEPALEAQADQGCRDLGGALWLAWRSGVEEGGAAGRRRRGVLMVPRDALSSEDWRRLRIWLRFRAELADCAPRSASR